VGEVLGTLLSKTLTKENKKTYTESVRQTQEKRKSRRAENLKLNDPKNMKVPRLGNKGENLPSRSFEKIGRIGAQPVKRERARK